LISFHYLLGFHLFPITVFIFFICSFNTQQSRKNYAQIQSVSGYFHLYLNPFSGDELIMAVVSIVSIKRNHYAKKIQTDFSSVKTRR